MLVDDPAAETPMHFVHALVAGDDAVAIRPQRDDAGGESARERLAGLAPDDRHRPLAVDVELVAGRVQVPGAHAGRTAADLAELEPLGSREPFHVRGAGLDAQHLHY